jgi:hypothetical protein
MEQQRSGGTQQQLANGDIANHAAAGNCLSKQRCRLSDRVQVLQQKMLLGYLDQQRQQYMLEQQELLLWQQQQQQQQQQQRA